MLLEVLVVKTERLTGVPRGLQDGKKTPLHLLCENEAVTAAALQVLLKHKADANAVDADGNSPLHYLGENASCSAAMVEVLLAAKADPNLQNQVRFATTVIMRRRPALIRPWRQFRSSATHYLLQNSALSLEMVTALLQHKADLNVKNNVRDGCDLSTSLSSV